METDSLRISPTLTSAPSPFTIDGTDAETFGASEDEITGANCSAGTNPFCTAWILQYDNADYLHCDVTAANPTCN